MGGFGGSRNPHRVLGFPITLVSFGIKFLMPTFKTPFYGITFLYRAPGGPTGGGRECPFWGGSKPYLAEPRKGPKIDAFLGPFLGPFDSVWAPLCQWGLGPPLAGLRGGPHWGGSPHWRGGVPTGGGGPQEGPSRGLSTIGGSIHRFILRNPLGLAMGC